MVNTKSLRPCAALIRGAVDARDVDQAREWVAVGKKGANSVARSRDLWKVISWLILTDLV